MNVQQILDELKTVEDKSLTVDIYDCQSAERYAVGGAVKCLHGIELEQMSCVPTMTVEELIEQLEFFDMDIVVYFGGVEIGSVDTSIDVVIDLNVNEG